VIKVTWPDGYYARWLYRVDGLPLHEVAERCGVTVDQAAEWIGAEPDAVRALALPEDPAELRRAECERRGHTLAAGESACPHCGTAYAEVLGAPSEPPAPLDREQAEQLARELEEAAARVRALPPTVHALELCDDIQTGPIGPSGEATVTQRSPRVRHFHLVWP
jgi:hypothetical protein